MKFLLSQPNAVHGSQLADEILQATGIDLGIDEDSLLSFIAPDIVLIPDLFVPDQPTFDAIQAVVSSHVPNSYHFPDQAERFRSTDSARAAVEAWVALPGWADWDVSTMKAWIDANVVDLASAKTTLKALGTQVIYIREVVAWLYLSRLRDLDIP